MLSEVCHPGHVQDASQGQPGLFSFNWVDQWMMTRLNGFNLAGSSQAASRVERARQRTPASGEFARVLVAFHHKLHVQKPRAVVVRRAHLGHICCLHRTEHRCAGLLSCK